MGAWSLSLAARWRDRTEAALMARVPGLRARIELLPSGVDTVYERQESAAD